MTLTLVVLGASRLECAQSPVHALMADELILIANPAARWGALGAIGNHYLDAALGDVLGLVHADTMLSDEVIVALVRAAECGVAGIVGSTGAGQTEQPSRTVWSADIGVPCPVVTLDSCAMFVSRVLARTHGLRFDVATFDSFHCCVEDFCLQAAARALPVVVAPGAAGHPLPQIKHAAESSSIGRRWEVGDHKRYKDKLEAKWGRVPTT